MKKILSLLSISSLLISSSVSLLYRETSESFANNFFMVNIPDITFKYNQPLEQNKIFYQLDAVDITAITGIKSMEAFIWMYDAVWLPGFFATIKPFSEDQQFKDLTIPVTNDWEEGISLAPSTIIEHEERPSGALMYAKLAYSVVLFRHEVLDHLILKINFLGQSLIEEWHPDLTIKSGDILIFRGRT